MRSCQGSFQTTNPATKILNSLAVFKETRASDCLISNMLALLKKTSFQYFLKSCLLNVRIITKLFDG